MKTGNPYCKFLPQESKIKQLEEISSRFKRVYSEYEFLTEELWIIENSEKNSVPDDFINALKLQTYYLEEEIEDWLTKKEINLI